jgi:type II restriction/modification system DNA methylase subunit YeeA
MDVVRRASDTWVIDFASMTIEEASCYELPFAHALAHVKPERAGDRNLKTRTYWWLYERSRLLLRHRLLGLARYIATPVVAKHRVFVWLPSAALPSNLLDAVARDDDTSFGILHSHIHELWALRMCTWLGVGNDPRYTPTTTFETFPFPEGLSPNIPAVQYAGDPRARLIASAAKRLNELRENWINPAELLDRVPEIALGYPDRLLPKSDSAERELKKRTLTNLYNANPLWLQNAHRELDEAVAKAYGWTWPLTDDELLQRLFRLNQERATTPSIGPP